MCPGKSGSKRVHQMIQIWKIKWSDTRRLRGVCVCVHDHVHVAVENPLLFLICAEVCEWWLIRKRASSSLSVSGCLPSERLPEPLLQIL